MVAREFPHKADTSSVRTTRDTRIAPRGGSRHTRGVMLMLGDVQLGPVPRIAAPLTDADLPLHAATAQRYADIVELRIDRFARHDVAYVADVCHTARALIVAGSSMISSWSCLNTSRSFHGWVTVFLMLAFRRVDSRQLL